MKLLFLSLLGLQALLMMVDEFYFHHRRGLGVWESLGHPLDTLSVVAVFTLVLFVDYNSVTQWGFLGLALLSCAMITKDEIIHAKECGGGEQWVHSVLFLLHPALFFCLFHFWKMGLDSNFIFNVTFENFLIFNIALITGFMFYQLLYWKGGRRVVRFNK